MKTSNALKRYKKNIINTHIPPHPADLPPSFGWEAGRLLEPATQHGLPLAVLFSPRPGFAYASPHIRPSVSGQLYDLSEKSAS